MKLRDEPCSCGWKFAAFHICLPAEVLEAPLPKSIRTEEQKAKYVANRRRRRAEKRKTLTCLEDGCEVETQRVGRCEPHKTARLAQQARDRRRNMTEAEREKRRAEDRERWHRLKKGKTPLR